MTRDSVGRRSSELETWLTNQPGAVAEPVTLWSIFDSWPRWARSRLSADQAMDVAEPVADRRGLAVRVTGSRHAVQRVELVPR